MSPNQKTNPSKQELFEQGKNEDSMGTNVYSAKDNQSMHKSLNGQFILYQLLIERLLDEKTALPKITSSGIYQYFQPDNENDQEIMREFDQDYQSEKAIHWYTRESCVYKLLNKALRTQNIDHVMAFAKLVRDLNKQLKEQHKLFSKTKKSSILTVFRGQFISKDELNRLKTTKGELISMNSFLSTSANKQKAIEFATTRSPPTDELTSILIEMQVNIKSQSRPLADIQHLSAFSDEEEILFMFGCIFRLDDVWYDDDLKIWRARLTLCGDGDLDMTDFLSSLDIELEGKNRLISLGIYLFQMQKYKEAEEHYEKVFEENLTTDPIELAYCHHGLAQVHEKKVDYQAAIDNLEKALSYLSSDNDHSLISKCYNDLGSIYNKQGQHRLAFQSYEKALKTMNNIPSTTYSGLAQIHFQFHNYNLAIEYLQKALDNHPSTAYISMANTYIEMGNIYAKMHDKDKASEMFDKAVECQLKILNLEHPDLSYTYGAKGMMYSDIGDQEQALEYIEKAYQLQLETLPNSHSDFADTYRNFGDIYLKKGDVDKALSYYQKSLENQLKSLLWNHPSVAETCSTIGHAHRMKKDYKQALIYFHKALDSELTRKKVGDLTLSSPYKTLAEIYFDNDNRNDALEFYLKYLANELETKLDEDISLTDTYQTIANLYYKKRLLSQSLLYYNRLLDCYLRQRPLNQSTIDDVYTMIGKVYLRKRQFDQTLLYYSQSTTNKKDFRTIDNIHFEQRHLEQAFDYFEKRLISTKADLSLLGDTYHILGNLSFERQDWNQALDHFRYFLENKFERKISIDDSSLSNVYKALATIYLKKNIFDQALIYANRLIDCRFRKKKSLDDQSVMDAYYLVGKIYLVKQESNYLSFEKRHLDQHLFFFHKLLERKFKDRSLKPFSLEDLYTIIGNMFVDKQDYYVALKYFHQSLHYQRDSSLGVAKTHTSIGDISNKQGMKDQAIEHYRQALRIYQRISPTNQAGIHHLKVQIYQILYENY